MSDIENNDLKFLLKRLEHLIKLEEYEKCIQINQWIKEIKENLNQNKYKWISYKETNRPKGKEWEDRVFIYLF